MTIAESLGISDAQLAEGRAFLRTVNMETLEAMLDTLRPGVRAGEAGPATWAAVDAIRSELEERAGEVDGH